MSHSKERHEKICLNCNAELHGRYCHQCGQENIEPKETVWGLISHFFYDITHFDGKFFGTTANLIKRPGFLPKEYIDGRRARYLHPIRMYVFTSALFFLVFFAMFHVDHVPGMAEEEQQLTKADSIELKLDSAGNAAAATTTGSYRYHSNDSTAALADSAHPAPKDSSHRKEEEGVDVGGGVHIKRPANWGMTINGKKISSVREYDSIQAALPASERDNWLQRRVNRRNIELKERYKEDDAAFLKDLLNKFFHTFPYLLFLSLPLYALFLKLLYVRHKKFYYVDHGIWLIYLYIFTFILLLLAFTFDKLQKALHWDWLVIIVVLLLLYGIWYAYKAMRKFYQQGTGKTLLKFMALNFLAFISIILLFGLFFVISVFQV